MPLRSQSPKRVGSGPLGPPNSGGNFWLDSWARRASASALARMPGLGNAPGNGRVGIGLIGHQPILHLQGVMENP